MKVLHLSDTPLSGSPVRISNLLNRVGGEDVESRHLVWHPVWGFRDFGSDVVSAELSVDEVEQHLEWADVIHYHNRYKRQEVFKKTGLKPPKKPSVIQVHSPRKSEDFSEELSSGLPIAVIAQFHVREWREAKFLVPNVVDIDLPEYQPLCANNSVPMVSYAPSNCTLRGWDDKGYHLTAPFLKRLAFSNKIIFQLIVKLPHAKCLELKRLADIGIDEMVTGSYHLNSLEYLAMGIPCFAGIDDLTKKAILDVTGASSIPWVVCKADQFECTLSEMIRTRSFTEKGIESRFWMEKYWNPEKLKDKYLSMYKELV